MSYNGLHLSGSRRHPRLSSPKASDIGRKHRPDYGLLVLMSLLLVIGTVVVYAIGPGLTNAKNLPESYYTVKQLTAISLGIIGFFAAANLPLSIWKKLQPMLIVSAVIAAFLVRVIGDKVNGAHRWIQVGGFSFQVAELIKLALLVWLADFLARRRLEGTMKSADTLKKLAIVIGVIVVIVIGVQSDFGSGTVMLAMIGVSAFVAGLPIKKLLIAGVVVTMIATLAVVTTPYRRDRIATFLNPTADCQKEGYQVCQALITVGSGGVFGKGLGHSVQAYGYLPFPENDSIFAIVAEKFGFVGTVTVLGIFWLLFRRISMVARNAPTDYTRFIVFGVLVWLSVQMIINVGAMVGVLPLKGITLPFVSYGGTSIIFVMIAMGVVFQVSRYSDNSAAEKESGVSTEENRRVRYSGYRRA